MHLEETENECCDNRLRRRATWKGNPIVQVSKMWQVEPCEAPTFDSKNLRCHLQGVWNKI